MRVSTAVEKKVWISGACHFLRLRRERVEGSLYRVSTTMYWYQASRYERISSYNTQRKNRCDLKPLPYVTMFVHRIVPDCFARLHSVARSKVGALLRVCLSNYGVIRSAQKSYIAHAIAVPGRHVLSVQLFNVRSWCYGKLA